MSKIIGKNYYYIKFELESPLSVGSGEKEESDKDILVDSLGYPFIPASSMTGVYREVLGETTAEKSFGRRLKSDQEEDGNLDESRIITYDAVLADSDEQRKFYIGKRDMVQLDEYKTAMKGKKFDFQILEPNTQMLTYIEENIYEGEQPEQSIEQILYIWKTRGLCFGTKTKRGYGVTKAADIKKIEFPEIKNSQWIDFDIYDSACWNAAEVWEPESELNTDYSKGFQIEMKLKQKGGLSIREYSTNVNEVDYAQLTLKTDKKTAVIPGTSWAGVFRAQMKKLGMSEACLNELFGSLKKELGIRSKLSFSESQIKDGSDKIFTRNAIDRFTGGTIQGALYKDSTRYLGTTDLKITCSSLDAAAPEEVSSILAAAIMDLHYGFMAVGGLTAIGRGLFEISKLKINGEDIVIDFDTVKTKLEQSLQKSDCRRD